MATEAEEALGLEVKLESAIENKTNRDSKIEINNLETEKIVEFETATLDSEFISNPESENILELTPELADNQFIFESAADAQSQLTLNEAFSADALALMNELDSAFNQKHVNNSTDEYIDLETLDAELESVLNEDVNHTEIAATEDLNKTESSSEIDENREIENHNEIKNHSET